MIAREYLLIIHPLILLQTAVQWPPLFVDAVAEIIAGIRVISVGALRAAVFQGIAGHQLARGEKQYQ